MHCSQSSDTSGLMTGWRWDHFLTSHGFTVGLVRYRWKCHLGLAIDLLYVTSRQPASETSVTKSYERRSLQFWQKSVKQTNAILFLDFAFINCDDMWRIVIILTALLILFMLNTLWESQSTYQTDFNDNSTIERKFKKKIIIATFSVSSQSFL